MGLSKVTIEWDDNDRPLITVEYAESRDESAEVDADEWLEALAERIPDKSAKYLRKLLELNQSRDHISLAELAMDMSVDKKEVDGWNRNLGRSIKAVVRDYGFLRPQQEDGTAQLFDFQWNNDGNVWLYAVPEKFRISLIGALDKR